jgi:hypothetical protein
VKIVNTRIDNERMKRELALLDTSCDQSSLSMMNDSLVLSSSGVGGPNSAQMLARRRRLLPPSVGSSFRSIAVSDKGSAINENSMWKNQTMLSGDVRQAIQTGESCELESNYRTIDEGQPSGAYTLNQAHKGFES